jgi:hypothetical protein
MDSTDTDSDIKMAGETGNILTGTNHCGAYKNALGKYEERKVSTICWISIVIVVLNAVTVAHQGLILIQTADALKNTLAIADLGINFDKLTGFMKITGYIAILYAALASAVTYFHCTRCNGSVAFFKLIGITIVSYAIVKLLWHKAVDETVDQSNMPEAQKDVLKGILRAKI